MRNDYSEGRAMRLFILLPLLVLASLPVQAQTKYSAWSNPDQSTNTHDLVERLNKLIDEAEKARAADPAFLRDLRDLTRGYTTPATRTRNVIALSDDFKDGDYTSGPTWTVSRGSYWVEQGWGLRSAVNVQGQQQQQTKKSSKRDAAIAILGAVLGQSAGGSTTTTTNASDIATIHTPATISNAFTIDLEFSSWVQQGQPVGGRFEIGPYQGADRSSGYQLNYTPGKGLSLMIVSPRGQRMIDQSTGPMNLEDKKSHALRWTRDRDGRMIISVDGKNILNTVDRGFGDPFQGLAMANHGGDYIIKRVTVNNAN